MLSIVVEKMPGVHGIYRVCPESLRVRLSVPLTIATLGTLWGLEVNGLCLARTDGFVNVSPLCAGRAKGDDGGGICRQGGGGKQRGDLLQVLLPVSGPLLLVLHLMLHLMARYRVSSFALPGFAIVSLAIPPSVSFHFCLRIS